VICASTGNTPPRPRPTPLAPGYAQSCSSPGESSGRQTGRRHRLWRRGHPDRWLFRRRLSMVVEISSASLSPGQLLNPYRLEGQKTAAFEICDVLGQARRWLCLRWVTPATSPPTGWVFAIRTDPLHGPQSGRPAAGLGAWCWAAGGPPRNGGHRIRIGRPARGEQALQAAEESHGRIIAVSDEQILAMQKRWPPTACGSNRPRPPPGRTGPRLQQGVQDHPGSASWPFARGTG
jgi:hypothetical protein